jgi:hypothetical protein
MHAFSHGLAFVVLALAASACTRSRVVAEGAECTSPYESTNPRLVCATPDKCLLMQSTAGYHCVRSCKNRDDCAVLGVAYRCEHYNGHGDEYGCVAP